GGPRTRRLGRAGVVELTSAAGHFWMRGHLFVDDHPYYARADAAGRFTFGQVPPGSYEIVCWLPSWFEEHRQRDTGTGLVTRLSFRPPVEVARPVAVGEGASRKVRLTVPAAAFHPGGGGR